MTSKENATKEPAEEEQEEERKVQDLEGDALVEEEKELDPIEELQQQWLPDSMESATKPNRHRCLKVMFIRQKNFLKFQNHFVKHWFCLSKANLLKQPLAMQCISTTSIFTVPRLKLLNPQ